jgi:hypothetical protein
MKSEFLKIAGVKSDKAFYKKYPTEAAFFKAHPEAKTKIKKAKIGAYIGGETLSNPGMVDFNKIYDANDMMITGMTDAMRKAEAEKAAAAEKESGGGGGGMGGMDMGSIMKMIGGGEGAEGMEAIGGAEGVAAIGGAEYGTRIHKAQKGAELFANYFNQPNVPDINSVLQSQTKSGGVDANMYKSNTAAPTNNTSGKTFAPGNYNSWDIDNNGVPDTVQGAEGNPLMTTTPRGAVGEEKAGSKFMDAVGKYAGPAGSLIQAGMALDAEDDALDSAIQQRDLSALNLLASRTRPEQRERRYVRPEDVVNTGEAFFPIYGVGTNVLGSARDGAKLQSGGMIEGNPTEVQNTYGNGRSIYDDLGYSPLINYDQDKSFRVGGYIPKAQTGLESFAMAGGSNFLNSGVTAVTGPNAGGDIGGTIGGVAGTAIGGPVGGMIGSTAGRIIGSIVDTKPAQAKKAQAQTKANLQNMTINQMAPSIQAGYASHVRNGGNISNYEEGGYMNPEYNPQVITMFGDVNDQDFADFAHKHEFRAGGHLKSYTPPSARAMETYEDGGEVRRSALNGEVQTTWGGGVKTLSHNPYMPGTGETIQFVGNSHDTYDPKSKQTGIGVKYGQGDQDSYTDYAEYGTEQADANVEVEKEPAAELIDPVTGEKNLTVWGNLKIPNQYIDILGDPKAKGQKFKNYVTNLSKTEEKQNKMIEKSTNELNALDVTSSFDRLKLASLEANIKGGNMKLQDIAAKKINAAGLQNAINDTAEEYGLVADDLARGKVKEDMTTREARLGAAISKAKDGVTTTTEQTTLTPTFRSDKEALDAGYKKVGNEYIKITQSNKKVIKQKKSAKAMDNIPKQKIDKTTGLGNVTPEQFEAYKKKNSWYPDWNTFDPTDQEDVDKYAKAFNAEAEKRGSKARILPDDIATGKVKWVGEQLVSSSLDTEEEESPIGEFIVDTAKVEPLPDTTPVKYKRNKLIDFGNQVLDYIRPSNQEPFDYAQTMGEQYALATNQLEPVQAQLYRPELRVPYDISFQDTLNENQADFNALTRKTGYNPAAQANVNANKYMANQKVLGEQFRANQAMKDQVYSGNVNTLNQAKMTNLGILDKQYERQSQAMSNTKGTTIAALNSITDKVAKNKLENRTLGVYENLYKYRYDKSGRAINMNGIFQPNIGTVGSMAATQRQVPVYDKEGKLDHYQLEQYDPSANGGVGTAPINRVAKDGKSIVKKNNKNSSIVKAIKNL